MANLHVSALLRLLYLNFYIDISTILSQKHRVNKNAYLTVCLNGEECSLNDVIRLSGIPKQTINSALRKPEKEEILYLETANGRNRQVILTDKGIALAKKSALPVQKMILGSLEFMFGTGGGALIALTLGSGKPKKINKTFSFLINGSIVCEIMLTVLGLILI